MLYRWTVGSLSATCFCLLFSSHAHGQQLSPRVWQGEKPQTPALQSPSGAASSRQPTPSSGVQATPTVNQEQPAPVVMQPPRKPHGQGSEGPSVQELPAIWPQEQPALPLQPTKQTQQPAPTEQLLTTPVAPVVEHTPGYLGANTRNFYRERFCMHALTIRGVEVETVLPGSPAARAGLRPARKLSARETAVAVAAGLLTLTPVAAIAPSFVQLSGGVSHGDIILAVNGQRVSNQGEFQDAIARVRSHTTAYLTVHRGETNIQLPVRFSEWPGAVYASTHE